MTIYARWPLTWGIATYAPHLARQLADLEAFHADESLLLDPDMDYSQVRGLSEEVRERLQRFRPTTLVSTQTPVLNPPSDCSVTTQGAAKRMEGMTPASAVYLLKHARRTWHTRNGPQEPVQMVSSP